MTDSIKDFESAIAELEKIVKQLEDGDLPLDTSLALFERSVGSDHPQVARPLATLGDIALDEKRYADAAEILERALAIYDRAQVTGTTVANVQFRLAAALRGLGRDPERVRSLATAARESAAEPEIPHIDAFLAELDAEN